MTTSSSERTILVVEDQPEVLSLLADALQMVGYRVLTAAHPDDGLAIGDEQAEHIDLVLTDVVMPGMNGPEMAQRLVFRHPLLRVLYLSGYDRETLPPLGVGGWPRLSQEALHDGRAGRARLRSPLPMNVLVADDEVIFRKMVRGVLVRAGHEVIEAAAGRRGAVASPGGRGAAHGHPRLDDARDWTASTCAAPSAPRRAASLRT